MKINLRRLISLTVAITVILSIFSISVFAFVDDKMTSHDLYCSQLDIYQRWIDGKITTFEMNEQVRSVTTKFCEDNSLTEAEFYYGVGMKLAAVGEAIGYAVDKYAENAREYVKDWWDGVCNKVPTETTQTSNVDYEGYGAVVVMPDGTVDYCQYVVRKVNDPNGLITEYAPRKRVTPWGSSSTSNSDVGFGDNTASWQYYGDIRWDDGTPAPTDDDFTYGTVKKFDDMSERELERLVNDLINAIELNNPDLSTLEGLLNAIYYRLGTLDSDDDEAMLSAINAAIISLASDNKASSAELIELLKELKDKKEEGADLEPVLDELKEINKSLDYLKTINTLDLIGDTVESLLELTETEQKYLDTYATLIINLTTKLGYAPVTAMINNLEALVLNGTEPQDLVISLYGTQVVLLSTSTFDNLQISGVLSLAKLFASVLLAISWLYSMRKKITGGV